MRATLTSAILPILSAALIVTGRPVHAADVDTLKGVRSLIVLIEDVAPEAKDDGLTVEDLRSEVEAQLRDAGLQIRGDATESLYININAHRIGTRDGRYMYNIEVRVSQPVRVLRTNEVAMSPTWSRSIIGTTVLTRLPESVRSDLKDLVDTLLDDHRSVNPRPIPPLR